MVSNIDKQDDARMTTDCRIVGRVRTLDGGGVGAAKIRCGDSKAVSLFDGSYEIKDLCAGEHVVTVSLDGFSMQSATATLAAGQTRTIDFKLNKASGTGKILGRVVDDRTGDPPTEASVTLILPVANRYATADKHGHFEFSDIPPGTYEILASAPGYGDEKMSVILTSGEIKHSEIRCKIRLPEEPPWG